VIQNLSIWLMIFLQECWEMEPDISTTARNTRASGEGEKVSIDK